MKRLLATVFLPFALGYYLSYTLRTANAMIASDLSREFGLTAGDLGFLTACFFLAVAGFQIPLGVLLDRFGPRRVQAALILFGAAGTLLFGMGQSLADLALARAMIGIGFAGGLMAAFKVIVLWFPRQRVPVLNILFMGFGGLGLLSSSAPAAWVVGEIGWRGLFWILGAMGVAVAALIFRLVPETPQAARPSSLLGSLRGVGRIYGDPLVRRVAPAACLVNGMMMGLTGLWSGPWLRDVGGFDRSGVAAGLTGIALAAICGYLAGAWAVDRLTRRGVSLVRMFGVGSAIYVLLVAALAVVPPAMGVVVWLGLAFMLNVPALVFTILSQHFPPDYAGRAVTGVNVLVFAGAFAVQSGFGWVVGLWPQDAIGGQYPAEGYAAGFMATALLPAVALLWLWIYRPAGGSEARPTER
ncbi:MAG: MFS transporter [Alphaproteobacteria bacterium]|nr:MFS transporter [Alphaproteobacteria bacterium]